MTGESLGADVHEDLSTTVASLVLAEADFLRAEQKYWELIERLNDPQDIISAFLQGIDPRHLAIQYVRVFFTGYEKNIRVISDIIDFLKGANVYSDRVLSAEGLHEVALSAVQRHEIWMGTVSYAKFSRGT